MWSALYNDESHSLFMLKDNLFFWLLHLRVVFNNHTLHLPAFFLVFLFFIDIGE